MDCVHRPDSVACVVIVAEIVVGVALTVSPVAVEAYALCGVGVPIWSAVGAADTTDESGAAVVSTGRTSVFTTE